MATAITVAATFRPGLALGRFLLITIMTVSCSMAAFAADLGLIEATTLNGNQAKWVVIDARPKAEWEAGHIPGALSLAWENYTRTDEKGVQFSSFPPAEVAASLAGQGIDERTPLVVYGDADKSWGGEGYDIWLFSWLGHKGPIRLLNGGIQAWRGQDLPLVKGAEKPHAQKPRYQFTLKPQLIIATEDVERLKGSATLVDVRSTFEWIKGKIPGAVHIPWDAFYAGKERRPLSAAEVKKLLVKHGVDQGKPVVYYCLGGVRSAYAWLVHELAGLPDARNYKGGMAAWQKRSDQ